LKSKGELTAGWPWLLDPIFEPGTEGIAPELTKYYPEDIFSPVVQEQDDINEANNVW
jgi:hypothetical protein